tara:strand:- start:321 stop:557 length:237 start_codon:yes stop_codon:yes gene_type:complete
MDIYEATKQERQQILDLVNTMRELGRQVTEGLPLEYNTIDKLRCPYILQKIFKFTEPENCDSPYYTDLIMEETNAKQK